MGGLLDLLGTDNPFQQAVAGNRGRLGAIGAGLASGQNFAAGLSNAAQMQPMGAKADDAFAASQKAEAERQKSLNATIEFMRQKGYDDLIAGVEGGGLDMGTAWGEALRRGQPKSSTPIEINGQLVDPSTGRVVGDYRDPNSGIKPTSSMQEYEFARQQGYDGTFQEYETGMKQAGATSIDFNQNQGVAAGFADRMAAANSILEDPALTAAQTDLWQQGLGKAPLFGNFMTSEQKKLADQAQRDFVNAILRRESGAVISPSEFENAAQQYFPQPGDTPAVIQQKSENRKIALQGVVRAAGPSYQTPSLTPPGVVPYTDFFR